GKIPVNTAKASGTKNVSTARQSFNRQAILTSTAMKVNIVKPIVNKDYPYRALQNKGIVDSGCSRHMTGNKAYLAEYQDFNGGPVAFGGSKGYITGKEYKPNVCRKGPTGLCDLDYLTDSMNYQLVRSENQANKHTGPQEANQNAGTEENIDAGDSPIEAESAQDYFVLPIWSSYTSTVKSSKAGEEPTKHPDFKQVDKEDQVFLDELERLKRQEHDANDAVEALRKEFAQETEDLLLQAGAAKASSTNIVNTASTPVSTASPYGGLSFTDLTNTDQDDSEIPALEEIYNNPTDGIFTNSSYDDEGAVADFTNLEPVVNKLCDALLEDYDAFKISEKFRYLVDLPYRRGNVEPKWVYRNKKDERGVVVRNKARLGCEKLPSGMGKIDEDVYVSQAPGMIDLSILRSLQSSKKLSMVYTKLPEPVQVYVDDIIFGSTKKSWCDEYKALMKSRFQMSSMGELTFFLGLQLKQKEDGIFISQDKYVAENLKKFDFVSVKTASTLIETQKPLVKDEEASDVDVHLYRSMIGSLMYLTASRPDIMFGRLYSKGGCQFSWQEGLFRGKFKKLDQVRRLLLMRLNMVVDTNCCGFSSGVTWDDLPPLACISLRGWQYDLLYSLYEVFSVQKNLDHSDDFHGVIMVFEESLG
ncbi:retrovirus-related pol polyprotein from transposon TNT 1-94, partial [Tanacetum coccineum]